MAKGNRLTIAVMFGMVFMVGFVTMFTGPLAAVVKAQFGASNALSQFGSSANFLAYLFMGLPCGMVLKRRGYKFTSLAAVSVGILGVALQILAGFAASFAVYIAGAFVAGLSMCMLNTTANPLLNTLGGGGNGGNRLVQYGCTFNSVGGMSSPLVLGFLIGNEVAKANVLDALPVQVAALLFFVFGFAVVLRADIPEPHLEPDAPSPWRDVFAAFKFRHFALGALAMFLFEPVECGICNMVNLYLTAEGTPAYAGAVVGGAMVSAYCALMMVGRFGAGVFGNRLSPRAMLVASTVFCIALLASAALVPFVKVPLPFTSVSLPLPAVLMTLCGLGIAVMFGSIFSLATEGLGRLVPVASGITMSLVSGGALLAAVGVVTDRFGILSSCWVFALFLGYILFFAAFGSGGRPARQPCRASGAKALACALFAFAALASGGVTLAPGRTEVVVAPKSRPAVFFAADELTNGLSRTLGGDIPLVERPTGGDVVSIVLGDCELSRAEGIDASRLAHDAFVTRATSNRVFIVGRDDPRYDLRRHMQSKTGYGTLLFNERATLFGVYDFLERHAGMRFYLPDDELGVVVRPARSVSVPETERTVEPSFLIRNPYFGGDGVWYNEREKGDNARIKSLEWLRLRMATFNIPCCHGSQFFRYIERFGKDHPEYLAMKKDGTRWDNPSVFAANQLCWSNPGFQEELYQDVKACLTGQPPSSRGLESWGHARRGKYVDIMPDDSFQGCHCERCQASYVRIPGDRHYATELIWGVTAKIARRLIDEGVDGNVTQMAYPPYRRVPDFSLPTNVQVMVAESGPWSLVDAAKVAGEEAEIRAWNEKLGHKVWIWTYPHKFGRTAIPGVPCMAPYAWGRYFKRMSPLIFGTFAESECDHAVYNHLNYYVFSRVAWDASTNVKAVVREYHELMYGAGADDMEEFNRKLERKWLKEVTGRIEDTSVGPVAKPPSSYQLWHDVYSRETRAELRTLLRAAASKVRRGSLEFRRIALMKREFLDPIVEAAEKFERETSVAAGLALRAREPNRSIVPPIGRDWYSKYELDTSTFVTPPHSIRFSGTNTAAVGFFFGTKGMPDIKPNTRYRLTYFVKTKDVEPRAMYGGGGGVSVNINDDHNRWFPAGNMFTGTMDWIFQRFEFTSGPDMGKHRPYFWLHRLGAAGTAWFDDVRLEEIDERGELVK